MLAGVSMLAKTASAWHARSRLALIEGQVVSVQPRTAAGPGWGPLPGTAERVFEVSFSYRAGGLARVGNTFSPLCTYCPAADILAATGRLPSELKPGMSLRVYADPSLPHRAYAALPSWHDMLNESLLGLLFALAAPAFFWIFAAAWGSAGEDSEPLDEAGPADDG
jgi:hypothetical protein